MPVRIDGFIYWKKRITDPSSETEESLKPTIIWAIGLATLVVTPSVYFFFDEFGAPFDDVFVTNFYHSPLAGGLESYAFLIGYALAIAVSVSVVLGLRRWTGAAFPGVQIVISILAVIYGLNFLRSGVFFLFSLGEVLAFFRSGSVLYLGLLALAVLAFVYLVVRYRRIVDYFLTRILRAYALVGVVFVFNAVAAIFVLAPYANLNVPSEPPTAAANADTKARQFIWMVFDEADQKFIFDDRDPTVSLPNLDRLKSMSVYTPDMKSPRRDSLWSLPAVMLGYKTEVEKASPNSPAVELPDGSRVLFSDAPNVFSDVRRAGGEIIIMVQNFYVGSLCRAFVKLTSRCWQASSWRTYPISISATIANSTMIVFKRFVYSMPLVRLVAPEYFIDIGDYGSYPVEYHYRSLSTMQDAVDKEIDSSLVRDRLYYMHWNVPHSPFLYDRHLDTLVEPQPDTIDSYNSNLELMDRMVGRVLHTIESSPNAQNTTLLVTSDHGTAPAGEDLRTLDIPFLLRSPDLPAPSEIRGNFEATSTRALINEWKDGTLDSIEDLQRILSR